MAIKKIREEGLGNESVDELFLEEISELNPKELELALPVNMELGKVEQEEEGLDSLYEELEANSSVNKIENASDDIIESAFENVKGEENGLDEEVSRMIKEAESEEIYDSVNPDSLWNYVKQKKIERAHEIVSQKEEEEMAWKVLSSGDDKDYDDGNMSGFKFSEEFISNVENQERAKQAFIDQMSKGDLRSAETIKSNFTNIDLKSNDVMVAMEECFLDFVAEGRGDWEKLAIGHDEHIDENSGDLFMPRSLFEKIINSPKFIDIAREGLKNSLVAGDLNSFEGLEKLMRDGNKAEFFEKFIKNYEMIEAAKQGFIKEMKTGHSVDDLNDAIAFKERTGLSDEIFEERDAVCAAEEVFDYDLINKRYDHLKRLVELFSIDRKFVIGKIEKYCEDNYSILTRKKRVRALIEAVGAVDEF